jgi:hypothetical protein
MGIFSGEEGKGRVPDKGKEEGSDASWQPWRTGCNGVWRDGWGRHCRYLLGLKVWVGVEGGGVIERGRWQWECHGSRRRGDQEG